MARTSQQEDQDKYDNLVLSVLNDVKKEVSNLHDKLERNTATTNKILTQARLTNGRVNTIEKEKIPILEADIKSLKDKDIPKTTKDLSPWYKDSLVIKIIIYVVGGAIALLLGIQLNVKDLNL